MPRLNDLMSSRSARKLDVELNDCRENLNTWFVLYSKLYEMKRSLNKKSLTQTDRAIQLVAKSYLRHHYADEMVYSDSDKESDDEESDAESDTIEMEDDTDPRTVQGRESKTTAVEREGTRTRTANTKTEFQNQALNVLNQHEDEQAVLDRHMAERRKEMQVSQHAKNTKNGEKCNNGVTFTLEVDKEVDSKVDEETNKSASTTRQVSEPRPDNLEVEEYEVLMEEEVSDNDETSGRVLTDEEVSRLASKCVQNGMVGVPDQPTGEEAQRVVDEDPEKALAGTMPSSALPSSALPSSVQPNSSSDVKQPVVKFITDTGEPPVVNALLKISPADRENLYRKLFETAKNNVMRQLGDTQIEPEKRFTLIKNESDRLLKVYIETH